MGKRYIDADEFVKRVIQYPRQSTKTIGLALADTPTADVQEVKHGEWKVAMLDHESMGCRPKVHYCSVCNHITTFRTFFCPNCGADMRGGTDG